jgi:hypothetical protein
VVTYEFENVPEESVEFLSRRIPVFPDAGALAVAQDRLREKTLFRELGIPTPPFAAVYSLAGLHQAVAQIGLPSVLKTRTLGYDGKGQAVLRTPDDIGPAWARLGGVPLILEGFVAFQRELSILGVRGRTGETAFYPLSENIHRDGILRLSRSRPEDPFQAWACARACSITWTTSACWPWNCFKWATPWWRTKWRHGCTIPATGPSRVPKPASSRIICAPSWACPSAAPPPWGRPPWLTSSARSPIPLAY